MDQTSFLFWRKCLKINSRRVNMSFFNAKLAQFLEEEFLNKISAEAKKPVSLRYLAKKFKLTVYGVKRLLEYNNSQRHTN